MTYIEPVRRRYILILELNVLPAFLNNSSLFYLLFTQVFIKSRFIMNGVCVVWKGWLDLQRLDGAGYLEFDEDKAQVSHKDEQPNWFLCASCLV